MGELNSESVTAYLGLGSNLGDRMANLSEAVKLLTDPGVLTVVGTSSIYETAPWGYTDQPDFLNCVVEIETRLTPVALFRRVERVEQDVGRVPSWRYGPRLIDVDILMYGDLCVRLTSPDLAIPHPRMDQRAFVLVPFSEIAGDVAHPGLHRSISSLAMTIEGKEGVRLWAPPLQLQT